MCFKFLSDNNDLIYIMLLIGSILLSIWSVIVNSIMQNPSVLDIFFFDPEQINFSRIGYIITNKYILTRLIHNYTAFAIPGLVLVFFTIKCLNKHNTSIRKSSFLIGVFIFILNISLLFSGHHQIKNTGDLNTHKYTSIIGSDKVVKVYFPGFKLPNNKEVTGIDVSRLYPKSIFEKIEKKPLQYYADNKYSASIFNFFHIMTLIWSLINVLVLYIMILIYKKHSISKFLFIMLYTMPLLAILSGWMVSELGRQPWLFYKVVLVSEISTSGNSFKLINNVIIQILLLFLLHWIIFSKSARKL